MPSHDVINSFKFPFKSYNFRQKTGKSQKFEYFKNLKCVLVKKSISHNFQGFSFGDDGEGSSLLFTRIYCTLM